MMFNLRDLAFREYILRHSLYCNFRKFSLFNKDEITDRDLLDFYFEYSHTIKNKNNEGFNFELARLSFNYKMNKISVDQVIKFEKIIKSVTGIALKFLRVGYSELQSQCKLLGCQEKFCKLVDIFLDQI